jgi:hypothetical protein
MGRPELCEVESGCEVYGDLLAYTQSELRELQSDGVI